MSGPVTIRVQVQLRDGQWGVYVAPVGFEGEPRWLEADSEGEAMSMHHDVVKMAQGHGGQLQ